MSKLISDFDKFVIYTPTETFNRDFRKILLSLHKFNIGLTTLTDIIDMLPLLLNYHKSERLFELLNNKIDLRITA